MEKVILTSHPDLEIKEGILNILSDIQDLHAEVFTPSFPIYRTIWRKCEVAQEVIDEYLGIIEELTYNGESELIPNLYEIYLDKDKEMESNFYK